MTQHVDVLALLKEAQSKPLTDPILAQLGIDLQKSTFAQGTSPTSGLTFYDLELGAKSLYPVLTPLRNAIPRVSGKGGIQAAWRAITYSAKGDTKLTVDQIRTHNLVGRKLGCWK